MDTFLELLRELLKGISFGCLSPLEICRDLWNDYGHRNVPVMTLLLLLSDSGFTTERQFFFQFYWNRDRATAKLLVIDCNARFLADAGRGRGPASECLESNCPCYHIRAVVPLRHYFAAPAIDQQHGQKFSQWWQITEFTLVQARK